MRIFFLMVVNVMFINFGTNTPVAARTIIGDSIMYAYPKDGGNSFSNESLVSILPKLAASHRPPIPFLQASLRS